MKLGVVADSHDNLVLIRRAVGYFNDEWPVDAVVHAGDYIAPFAVREFAKLRPPVHGVFGNNDGEHAGIRKVMPQIADPPLRLELDGRTIVVTHDLETLSADDTKDADIVICGHTHSPRIERTGFLLVNPGECGGWLTGACTVAVVDLESLDARIVTLDDE
jgi:putative phosphoesterase